MGDSLLKIGVLSLFKSQELLVLLCLGFQVELRSVAAYNSLSLARFSVYNYPLLPCPT